MANGLSMKVLLQLQKKQFDQGISQVKTSLAGLGRTIKNFSGMLLGGLGLSALLGQFKQASTEMSVAKATLENVSKGFKEYSENMAFLKNISKSVKIKFNFHSGSFLISFILRISVLFIDLMRFFFHFQ